MKKKILSALPFFAMVSCLNVGTLFSATPMTAFAAEISTVADVLATVEDFPTRPAGAGTTVPENAWKNASGDILYSWAGDLEFVDAAGPYFEITNNPAVTEDNGNYKYTISGDGWEKTITFNMENGVLVSVNVVNTLDYLCEGLYTAPVSWPEDAPTEAPAAPTYDGASLLGAPLTTNLEFEPLDWPGSKPEKLTFETGETIYYMEKMSWQIYTNWAEDSYDMSEYDMFHIDLFPATGTEIKVTFEGLGASDGGQGYKNSVVKTLTAGEWNSLDIALSEFPGLISGDAYDFSDIKYLILEGYDADQTALSVGNVYFYKASHEHAIKTTHAKVEAKCEEAGHEAYYECSCGKYFSNEDLTEEISDLDLWLAEDGEGYLAPLGHHFSGEVTYTWDGDKCTARWKCDHAGCTETQTETVTGVYVKDSDATTESNEKGHYEATFTVQGFEKQSTATNSVEIPNTKLPKGLSGGAIAGIIVGAVAGVALISYAVMFAVYVKSGKGLKFLFKSFDWLKKLFRIK